jgi:hypothetical protein
MENLPDDETMEILTDDQMKEWKVALALIQPETTEDNQLQGTEDKKQQDTGENEETLNNNNATEFYAELVLKAKDLKEKSGDDSDEGIAILIEKLESLVFPYIENATEKATLRAKTLLEARAALAKASGVSETTDVVLSDDDIDARMTAGELSLLEVLKKSNDSDALTTLLRDTARSRLDELNKKDDELNKSQVETQSRLDELNKSYLANELNLLVSLAERVKGKTKEIDSVLGEMATLTQAENTVGGTTMLVEQNKRQRDLEQRANIQHRDKEDNFLPRDNPAAIDVLYRDATPVPRDSPFQKTGLQTFWNDLDETTKKRIQAIHKTYNAFIIKSTILERQRQGGTKTGAAEETAPNEGGSPKKQGNKRPSTNTSTASTNKCSKTSTTPEEGYQYKTIITESTKTDTKTSTIPEEDCPEYKTIITESTKTDTETSTTPEEDCSEYKTRITESTKNLAELFRCDVQSNPHPQPTDDNTRHYFPGPRGQEVLGAQPVFSCLLDAIGSVAEKRHVQRYSTKAGTQSLVESPEPNGSVEAACKQEKSPPKSGWGKESAVQGRTGRFRYGDFVIKKSGRHFWLYRSDTLPVVIEIKAFYRPDKAWNDLITNAVQQVLNHTSRYVRVGLNFAGAGVESHATGAIGSLAYIQVFRLELKDPGTEETCLKIVKSELLPLMDKESFEHWMEGLHPGYGSENSKAVQHMFPQKDEAPEGAPFGLLMMYQLMVSSKSELFGQVHAAKANSLQLLASGAFGNVFLGKENTVVKFSRHGREAYLSAEAFAYKAVGHFEKEKPLCAHLAVAKFESTCVVIGAITRKMRSLVLKPAGKPLVHLGDIRGGKLLYDVVFGVALALKHMHNKNVAHNDVSLANVVVVGGKAVLVDLSLACPFTFEIPIFRGNPVYVHRDVHKDAAWEPRPFHDLAALGFLAAVLASGSIVPWLGFSSPVRDDSSYDNRYQVANDAIKELPDTRCRSQIIKWISFDREKTIVRKPCRCRKGCKRRCGCAVRKLKCLETCSCSQSGSSCANNARSKFELPERCDGVYDRPE